MSTRDSRRRPASPREATDRQRPRKQFGQHFLTDPNLLQKIVRAGNVQPGEVVLEIGPGRGHLTRALLAAGAQVVAIEIDRDLAKRLVVETQPNSALTVLEGDFLTATPEEWLERAGLRGVDYKVVANLPYYITSAILRHLLESAHSPSQIVVMVQREVARQITAKPGDMNVLAISVQFYGQPQLIGVVPAGAFTPRPQVDSAIVRITVDPSPRWPEVDPQRFFEIVRAGLSGRRKQLHNSLAHGLGLDAETANIVLARAGIDPRRRAETLSLYEWRTLYAQLQNKP